MAFDPRLSPSGPLLPPPPPPVVGNVYAFAAPSADRLYGAGFSGFIEDAGASPLSAALPAVNAGDVIAITWAVTGSNFGPVPMAVLVQAAIVGAGELGTTYRVTGSASYLNAAHDRVTLSGSVAVAVPGMGWPLVGVPIVRLLLTLGAETFFIKRADDLGTDGSVALAAAVVVGSMVVPPNVLITP